MNKEVPLNKIAHVAVEVVFSKWEVSSYQSF